MQTRIGASTRLFLAPLVVLFQSSVWMQCATKLPCASPCAIDLGHSGSCSAHITLSPHTFAHQVLAAAGAVKHEELVKLAEAAFGSIPDEDASTSVRTLLAKVGSTTEVGPTGWPTSWLAGWLEIGVLYA
jgi:hypothetical protein